VQDEFVFPKEWTLFGPVGKDDPAPDFAGMKDIPAELTIAGQRLAARQAVFAFNRLDLGARLGGGCEGKTAFLLANVEVAKDTEVELGAGADYWMKWWVNGEVVCDTLADGNGPNYPPSVGDHPFTARLKAGRNLVAVKVVSGSDPNSFYLAAGGPREVRAEEELRKMPARFTCAWQPHVVRQCREGKEVNLPAEALMVTEELQRRSIRLQMLRFWHLQMVFMPERQRLLLSSGGKGWTSDDLGATWTMSDLNYADSLTYLGNGLVLGRSSTAYELSADYGETWRHVAPVAPLPNGRPYYGLGRLQVDRDPQTGRITRLLEPVFDDQGHGFVRCSTDGGASWPTVLPAPWISETEIIRAGNGDLVAATRTDGSAAITDPHGPYDWRRVGMAQDFYSGLGVHVSADNGLTWSPLQTLYAYGRHHPSLVMLPDATLVMSYVVRLGYEDTPDGLPQYGIEAVISRDHGRSWQLDRRYILDAWPGEWLDRPRVKLVAPTITSTVRLSDGRLLTACNTGVRGDRRDLKLVRWRC